MRSLYNNLADMLERRFKVDAHYFLSGGFWLSLGQVATITFGLATTALFAYFLNENDYGTYRYLIGIAVILSSFSLTGLGQAILQTAAKKYYGFYRETLKTNFVYSLTITASALIGVSYYWFNENSTLAIGCLLIAFLQPFINTFQFIPSFLQGSKRFKESTILHTVRMFVISTSSIMALLLTQNILILFSVYLASYFITNLVSHLVFSPRTTEISKEIKRKYLSYAKHTSVRNVVANISQKIDSIIIFTQLGALELAIYSIATVVPEQIKGSFKSLSTLLLSKYVGQSDISILEKGVPKRSLQLFLILVIITVIYILIAPFIYQFIFPKYPDAIFYSQLSALAFPAFILYIPFNLLKAKLAEKTLYKLTLYSSIFQIGVVTIGILTLGLLGAIIAKIIYRIFFMITVYSLLNENIKHEK